MLNSTDLPCRYFVFVGIRWNKKDLFQWKQNRYMLKVLTCIKVRHYKVHPCIQRPENYIFLFPHIYSRYILKHQKWNRVQSMRGIQTTFGFLISTDFFRKIHKLWQIDHYTSYMYNHRFSRIYMYCYLQRTFNCNINSQ